MAWPTLGSQFCLELAFGVLFAMAFVPRAPVGRFFYRLMGTTALIPVLVAILAPTTTGALPWHAPSNLCGALALLSYPLYAGPPRGRRWTVGLGLALLGTMSAVVVTLASGSPSLTSADLFLAGASALSTGSVAGSVGLAMVLGHWYLTVPDLEIRHLQRLNRVTIVSMLVSLLLVASTCLVHVESLDSGETPLFAATGLFHLGTRLIVGLFFPLAFAGMAASSLRYRNTRSATGILYASTVLVLIGTAVSLTLQDSYGFPL